jgi:hypothetical protein
VSLDPNKTIVNILEVLLHISRMIPESGAQHLIYYFLHLAAGEARVSGSGRSRWGLRRRTGGICGFSHFIVSFLKII